MQVVRITESYFETDSGGNAIEKFKGGKLYPLDGTSQRQVDLGNGELVEAPDDFGKAQAAAEKAAAAAEAAAAKAEDAAAAAEAAAVAVQAPAEAAAEPAAT